MESVLSCTEGEKLAAFVELESAMLSGCQDNNKGADREMKKNNRKRRLRLTAYHEAAHAVVNYRAAGFVGGYVSIVPRQKENVLRLGVATDAWSDSFKSEHMEAKIVSLYAGGHAQRILEPSEGAQGCDSDDAQAEEELRLHGWEHRAQELRERSLALTRQHWAEVVAVAGELLRVRVLDDTEVELICDAVAGGSGCRPCAVSREFRPATTGVAEAGAATRLTPNGCRKSQ